MVRQSWSHICSTALIYPYRSSIKRRHVAVKASAVETLQTQFSGYGATSKVIARTLDRLALKEPLEHWSDEMVESVVGAFIDEKFPTVIALNKIDHSDADKVRWLRVFMFMLSKRITASRTSLKLLRCKIRRLWYYVRQ